MGFGGGSGSSISGASDVGLNNPAAGQGLVFDTATGKWKNQPVYAKPTGGIPITDLSSNTQAKLNAATSVLLLDPAQAVPANTPDGTLIFRKPS